MEWLFQREPPRWGVITGPLKLNDAHICWASENSSRWSDGRIVRDGALPIGRHEIRLKMVKSMVRTLPMVMLENRNPVPIVDDDQVVSDRILVGAVRGAHALYDFQEAFRDVMAKMQIAWTSGEQIFLTIEDVVP